MSVKKMDGAHLRHLIAVSAERLRAELEAINGLNVFPVPDGDTGTNMYLTWQSGLQELIKSADEHIGQTAKSLSHGLLVGARGNSGVILSQLFRGLCKYIEKNEVMTPLQMAAAMQYGVDMAYRVIQRPTEGTILTVAKDTAKYAVAHAGEWGDFAEMFDALIDKANESLARTPELLPILKKAGVVDAGGRGLVVLYEGMLEAVRTYDSAPRKPLAVVHASPELAHHVDTEKETPADHVTKPLHSLAQLHFSTDDITFGYCTELMIRLGGDRAERATFAESEFRAHLESLGDSLLVVADDEWVKVHIHTERPGEVLNEAARYGELDRLKIDNMRLQHEEIVGTAPDKPYGIVAVASGEGMSDLFRSMGADVIISGGQSMNPSTEQFLEACSSIRAKHYMLLPNNANVVMAARQATEVSDQSITVIPTTSMQHGLASLLSFQTDCTPEENLQRMSDSLSHVQTAQLTQAVRDTELDGMSIRTGDYIGICGKQIRSAHPEVTESLKELLKAFIQEEHSLLTIYSGKAAEPEVNATIQTWLEEQYPDLEVETYDGGQPVYHYLLAIE